jgi:hypothetical protein
MTEITHGRQGPALYVKSSVGRKHRDSRADPKQRPAQCAERRCKIEAKGWNYFPLPGIAQPSNAAVWKERVFPMVHFYVFIR